MNPTRADNLALMGLGMQVLNAIEEIGEGYVFQVRIAGGAARDSHLDVPIRDVDILISFKVDVSNARREAILREAFEPFASTPVKFHGEEYGDAGELFCSTMVAGYNFEVIEIAPETYIKDYVDFEYPDSISKVMLDSSGQYISTPDFRETLRSRVVWVKPGHSARIEKLKKKFPEYEFRFEEDDLFLDSDL